MCATNYETAKLTTHKDDTTGKEFHYANHNNWEWGILERGANGFYDTSPGYGGDADMHADW